jgi:hypothetical protein
MTAGFDEAEQSDRLLVQLHTDSPYWCGDLFFSYQGFEGHFHGFRRDTESHQGLVIYFGLYSNASDVVDFTNPFVVANLEQTWDAGAGRSDACELPCQPMVRCPGGS